MSQIKLKELPEENYVFPGNFSCAGCGSILAVRLAMKVLGKNTIVVVPAGCLTSVTAGPFPKTAFAVPVVHCAFECTAAVESGIAAALKVKGKKGITVVGIAGDGGTADIGIQSLSGAVERGHNIKYICYDNEAYSNTGIQKSGTTPYGAWTTTTPVGKLRHYKRVPKKDVALMMAAQGIPYSATASVAYPRDYMEKVRKMKETEGPVYLHVQAPCPIGWRFKSDMTIEIAKLAVLSGAWILYEVDHGWFHLTGPSKRLIDTRKRVPVKEYLALQGRFKHLTNKEIEEVQEVVNNKWETIKTLVKI